MLEARDYSRCTFRNTTPVRYTYLPSFAIMDEMLCSTGTTDFAGAACTHEQSFSSDIQLVSSQSTSLSASVQAGLEGILMVTASFGYEKSLSSQNGQTLSHSETLALPQGRHGYATFKPLVQCKSHADKGIITDFHRRVWCIRGLRRCQGRAKNQSVVPSGICSYKQSGWQQSSD